MSQFAGDDTMSMYDMVSDGRHFVPKETEETEPRLSKKGKIIIACAVAAVIVIALVLRANSLSIALLSKGVDVDTVTRTAQSSYPLTGADYVILHGNTGDGAPALIRGVENAFGFWQIDAMEVITDEKPVISMAWSETGGVWHRDAEQVPLTDHTCWQVLYKGSNANGEIAFKDGQLPDDCTVWISQSDGDYIIQIASFSEDLSKIPVIEYLQQNGCITAD